MNLPSKSSALAVVALADEQRQRRVRRARLHGQAIYVDPKAEMASALYASFSDGGECVQ